MDSTESPRSGLGMASDGQSGRGGLLASLGPGLVWAATAIGVSHLVQSTRAGAAYGFALVGVVILANLLKYPFFEFGPRYAAATGESLLEGYERLGNWAVWIYLLLTVGTMFTVVGAVTFVTGALATQLFGSSLFGLAMSPFAYSAVLLVLCALILIPGRYPLLDALIKVIIVVLTISTVVAVISAATVSRQPVAGFVPPSPWNAAAFPFLIALVGWMPSAVDISVWHSLWTLERAKQTGHHPTLRESLFDFNLGYVGTTLIALCFLSLGALIFHGSGEEIPANGGAFAALLIRLYTEALGPWSRPIILAAAFTTMFSTTLSCLDAFPRVLRRTGEILLPRLRQRGGEAVYWGSMLVLITGSLSLISLFVGGLTRMVDVATVLSFLTSPVLGLFNYRVVTGATMPEGARPPRWLRWLARLGIAFGVALGIAFLVIRFASPAPP